MSTNFVQPGGTITWTNDTGSDVSSNEVVALGHMICIAAVDIADGKTGNLFTEGVYNNIPKVTAAVFGKGDKLLWDSSASKFDDPDATAATGDIMGGAVAWEAGTNTDTTCTIKLTPGNATKT